MSKHVSHNKSKKNQKKKEKKDNIGTLYHAHLKSQPSVNKECLMATSSSGHPETLYPEPVPLSKKPIFKTFQGSLSTVQGIDNV